MWACFSCGVRKEAYGCPPPRTRKEVSLGPLKMLEKRRGLGLLQERKEERGYKTF